MNGIRGALLGLVGLSLLFLARGWFGLPAAGPGDAAAVISVFGALTAILAVPAALRLRRSAWLVLWLGVYGVGRWVAAAVTGQSWLAAGREFDFTLALAYVAGGAWLAHGLGHGLHDLMATVERVTLVTAGHPLTTLDQAGEDIRRELARSRRYHYPLSLMLLEVDRATARANLHRAVLELRQSVMVRYVLGSLVRFVQDHMRRTDMILDPQSEGRLVLITPDTNLDEAKQLAARIQTVAAERFSVHVDYGLATFPADALSFDELLSLARERVTHSPVMPANGRAATAEGLTTPEAPTAQPMGTHHE